MKFGLLGSFSLLCLIAALLPSAASAQVSDSCESYYCTAYAIYSGGTLSGYLQYYDDTEDWYLGIDATVTDESGADVGGCSGGEGYDIATAYCSYTPNGNGSWALSGDVWYWTESPQPDGNITISVGVQNQPTGEDVGYYDWVNVGFIFLATLDPIGFNFSNGTEAEALGDTSDSCWTTYHASTGPASATASPPFTTTSSSYQDTVSVPSAYYEANRDATAISGNSCTWTVFQTMSYNSAPYTTRYLWWTVLGTNVSACRTYCTSQSFY